MTAQTGQHGWQRVIEQVGQRFHRSAAESPHPAPARRIRYVTPRRQHWLGRTLAFAMDGAVVQMAAAVHGLRGPRLLDTDKVYLPADAQPEELRQIALREIDRFLNRWYTRRARIIVVTGGPKSVIRTITLPAMSPRELAVAVESQARLQLPFAIEEAYYDYRPVLKASGAGGSTSVHLSLVAVTRTLVHDLLEPLEKLGRRVSAVHIGKDVLGVLLEHLPEFERTGLYALINVSKQQSEISFYRGTQVQFTHVANVGTAFLAQHAGPVAFEYFSESLAAEIQNSLDYFAGQFSEGFRNRVYVYGDLAYSDELIGFLSERFGFEFRPFPVEALPGSQYLDPALKEALAPNLEVVAAALNDYRLGNLLPPERLAEFRYRRIHRRGAAVLAATLLLLAPLTHAQWQRLVTARAELADLRENIEQIQSSELYAAYTALQRRIQQQERFVAQARPTPSYLSLSLKELSRLTPPEIRLSQFLLRADRPGLNLELSGTVSSADPPPEVILAEFVEALYDSPFYDSVTVRRHVKRRQGKVFRLDFNLGMRGRT